MKSHIYTKSILKSFLKFHFNEYGNFKIHKVFSEFKKSDFKINSIDDINIFLENDDFFYFNGDYKKFENIEKYWNETIETPYFNLINKMKNKFINDKKSKVSEINNLFFNDKNDIKNKTIILKFVALTMYRTNFIKEPQPTIVFELKNNELFLNSKYINYNFSNIMFQSEEYVNEITNEYKTDMFVNSFLKYIQDKNYLIQITEIPLKDVLFDPIIINLLFYQNEQINKNHSNIIILPNAYKNWAISLIPQSAENIIREKDYFNSESFYSDLINSWLMVNPYGIIYKIQSDFLSNDEENLHKWEGQWNQIVKIKTQIIEQKNEEKIQNEDFVFKIKETK